MKKGLNTIMFNDKEISPYLIKTMSFIVKCYYCACGKSIINTQFFKCNQTLNAHLYVQELQRVSKCLIEEPFVRKTLTRKIKFPT